MSDHLKKHLTTQLEILDESSFHLQSSISDFVQQIQTRAMECVDKVSDIDMTMKDALTMVTTAQSTLLEQADILTESCRKLHSPTVFTVDRTTPEIENNAEIISRLNDIETTLSSLQDTKQKTEDDISEIKQWRDNFEIEQSNIKINIEKLSKKQKLNFKNLRKQINEQDNKIEELKKVIARLKTKESDTVKNLEKLSLDMKEYANNLHKLNKEMRVYTDKTDYVAKETERLTFLQEDTTSTLKITLPKIETLEINVSKLSQDFTIFANRRVKHSTLGFIASYGHLETRGNTIHPVIRFKTLERIAGNHYNDGIFTAPVDGLYIAILRIKQLGASEVSACFMHVAGDTYSPIVHVTTKTNPEPSMTIVLWMKTGELLYASTSTMKCRCTHFSCFLLGV